MKIIWLGTYREDSCARYFRRQLGETVDIKNYGEGPGINPHISHGYRKPDREEWNDCYDAREIEKNEKPDWFVVYSYVDKSFFWPYLRNLENIKTPKAIIINDPIQDTDKIIPKLEKWKIDKVFCVYWGEGLVDRFREKYNAQYYHLPYSIDTKVFFPRDEMKPIDIGFAGAQSSYWYPFRTKLLFASQKLSNKYHLEIKIGHPLESSAYASFISHSKIFPVTGGRYRYAVAKYFEVMACKTLVVGDLPIDKETLHFKEGKNLIEIRENKIEEDLIFWLENETERRKITDDGYKTILKYHTNEKRIEEFLEMLKE